MSEKKDGEQPEFEMIRLSENVDGEAYLEGQQPEAVKELWELGVANLRRKEQHALLTKQLSEDKAALLVASRKYRKVFTRSDDGTKYLYAVGGLELEVDHEETETIKTRKGDPPPPISKEKIEGETSKPAGKGKGKGKGANPAEIY